MTPVVPALVARARGLGTHLLPRATLRAALETADLDGLTRTLEAQGIPAVPRPASALGLELAVRRWAARELARLARWLPPAAALEGALFGEEEVRSLRALLRGVAAGEPAERRLAGLLPTPRLPERLLAELARQSSANGVAALLATWEHPLGGALLEAVAPAEPDLASVEHALVRAHVGALMTAARRWGSGLRGWVRETVDLTNARLAIGMAARDEEPPLDRALLPGGSLPPAAFAPVVAADTPADAARRVASLLPAGPVAEAFARSASRLADLDDALLAARIMQLRAHVRLDPLGPEVVLLYALRLRAQVVLLRLATWRLALGVTLPDAGPLLEAAA